MEVLQTLLLILLVVGLITGVVLVAVYQWKKNQKPKTTGDEADHAETPPVRKERGNRALAWALGIIAFSIFVPFFLLPAMLAAAIFFNPQLKERWEGEAAARKAEAESPARAWAIVAPVGKRSPEYRPREGYFFMGIPEVDCVGYYNGMPTGIPISPTWVPSFKKLWSVQYMAQGDKPVVVNAREIKIGSE